MTISNTIRVPFMYVSIDSSRAAQGPALLAYKALLVGQLLSTGTKYQAGSDAVGPYKITSSDQAGTFFGIGSMIHRMAIAWFAGNRVTELWVIAMKDNGTTKSTGSIAITGPATAAGTLFAYVNGKQIQVAVSSGDSATVIGDALVAAIPINLPVTAVNTTGTVTFTAKNAGTVGNDIDLRLNYNPGEELPAGVAGVVTGMSSGATDPDIANAISLLGDAWYNIIIGPYTDANNLTALEAELADRFGPMRQIDGVYVTAKKDTLANLSSFGSGRNSPHVSCLNAGGVTGVGTPTWTAEMAAAYGAQLAIEGQADPARPFQTLELTGVIAPEINERFSSAENNNLLYDGISTVYVDSAGRMRIQRAISMYQTNSQGAEDTAYLDINSMLTLMYLRYSFRNMILTKYPRAKLADDDVKLAPTQQYITPKIGKAEAIAIFRQWMDLGLVEDITQFKNDVVCVRNSQDPNRLDWLLPPDLMNQFRIGTAVIQFLL